MTNSNLVGKTFTFGKTNRSITVVSVEKSDTCLSGYVVTYSIKSGQLRNQDLGYFKELHKIK